MNTRRHGGITGKARRVHRLTRASHRMASDAIDEYFMPDDRPTCRSSIVPVRRGERFLASFNGRRGETLPTQQLELPYKAGADTSRSKKSSAAPEQIDTGWTLIRPEDTERESAASKGSAATTAGDDRTNGAGKVVADARTPSPGSPEVAAPPDAKSPPDPKPTPVIRAPRYPQTATEKKSDDTFSIRRFLMGCAAGLATAAMILMTIRLAVG